MKGSLAAMVFATEAYLEAHPEHPGTIAYLDDQRRGGRCAERHDPGGGLARRVSSSALNTASSESRVRRPTSAT